MGGPDGRCRQQFGVGSHAAFDVGVEIRQKGSQDSSRGNTMPTETRIRMDGRKSFLQEIHADSLSAADLFQRLRIPRFAFEHFRQQRQTHRDHFAVLSKAAGDGADELFFFGREIRGIGGNLPKA
jgi:hypothetical protein